MTMIKIVIYCKDIESEQLLIDTVTRQYKHVVTVSSSGEIAKHLKEGDTKIVMVSTDNFKNSLAIYYHALSYIPDSELPEHAFLPLVTRHDEKQAWEAFNAGFADDYIVSRPLYEPHRPIMICDHLLKEMGVAKQTSSGKEFQDQLEQMPERIRDVIKSGIVRKENLKKEFEQTIRLVDKALDTAADKIQSNQSVKLDMEQLKQTLSAIRSDEIRPELLKLQDKAISLLQHVFTDLNKQAANEPNQEPQAGDNEQSATQEPPKFNNLHNSSVPVPETTKTPSIPRVLVVDDDAISLSVTVKTLQSYLMKVDTTSSGRRAFASLSSQEYDLVFIDINLTDCNGLFVIDQLRNSGGPNKDIPKVVLTSNRDKQSIKTASEVGASEYLIKPLQKDTIIKLYKKYQISLLKKK